MAAARFSSAAVFVEERQMDPRHRASRQRRPRVLGTKRLPHARRPVEERAVWLVGGDRGIRRNGNVENHLNSKMNSISTAASRGSVLTPTAARTCFPDSPNSSTRNSLAPL